MRHRVFTRQLFLNDDACLQHLRREQGLPSVSDTVSSWCDAVQLAIRLIDHNITILLLVLVTVDNDLLPLLLTTLVLLLLWLCTTLTPAAASRDSAS